MKTIDWTWTPYTKMDPSHRLYGARCNRLGRRTGYVACRGKARYISTLGHLATVRCDKCQGEAVSGEGGE